METPMRHWLCNISMLVVLLVLGVAPLNAQVYATSYSTKEEEYRKARKLFNQGKITKARKVWSDLLQNRDWELEAKHKRALRKCIANCDAVLQKRREAARSNVDRALDCVEKARPLLRAFLPTKVMEKEKILKKAIKYLNSVEKRGREDPRYHYVYAFCLFHIDRLSKVAPHIEKALNNLPKDPRPSALRAAYLWRKDQLEQAIEAAELSIALQDVGNSDAYYWKVRALLSRNQDGDIRKAWQFSKRAIGQRAERAEELANLFPEIGAPEVLHN